MKPEQDFEKLMRDARAMRAQYVGGLLRGAWNAVIGRFRLFTIVPDNRDRSSKFKLMPPMSMR